jgi:hypothetical protein
MELECVKYHEKMDSEHAACRHPDDYCQHRTSCMIHFIGKENSRASGGSSADDEEQHDQGETD